MGPRGTKPGGITLKAKHSCSMVHNITEHNNTNVPNTETQTRGGKGNSRGKDKAKGKGGSPHKLTFGRPNVDILKSYVFLVVV